MAEIYRTLWDYNNTRIHSALNMPPVVFAKLYALVAQKTLRISVRRNQSLTQRVHLCGHQREGSPTTTQNDQESIELCS